MTRAIFFATPFSIMIQRINACLDLFSSLLYCTSIVPSPLLDEETDQWLRVGSVSGYLQHSHALLLLLSLHQRHLACKEPGLEPLSACLERSITVCSYCIVRVVDS